MFRKIVNGKVTFLPLTTTVNGQLLENVLKNDSASFKTIKIEGRRAGEYNHQVTEVLGRHGAYYHQKTKDSLPLTWTVYLKANDVTSFGRLASNLHALLTKEKTTKFEFSDDDGCYYLGQLKKFTYPNEKRCEAIVEIEIICYEPYKFKDIKSFKGNIINYKGQVSTKPIITLNLSSQTKEIRLLHVESQKYIRLTGTYTIDEIKINMATGKITQNGRNILGDLDMVNSRYFELLPGENTLQCDNATITADFREVYL
ncbi:TPA: distal tail protein Dit [Streptococcus pyogenes]|nr:phage tail family protein [Streptococcus pyogenes]